MDISGTGETGMRWRNLLEIDFLILLPVMFLIVIGILFIYSSGITSTGELVSNEHIKQIVWASVGLAIALALVMIDYRRFHKFSLYLYLFILLMLMYIFIFGRIGGQGTRWLRIGIFTFQASEFAKITTILFLARYLADTRMNSNTLVRFIISCLIVAIPMGLVFIQPDLGTALVFIPILLSMAFVAGLSMRYIIFSISCIALTGVLMVLPLWQTHILQKSITIIEALANFRIIQIILLALSVICAIAL